MYHYKYVSFLLYPIMNEYNKRGISFLKWIARSNNSLSLYSIYFKIFLHIDSSVLFKCLTHSILAQCGTYEIRSIIFIAIKTHTECTCEKMFYYMISSDKKVSLEDIETDVTEILSFHERIFERVQTQHSACIIYNG